MYDVILFDVDGTLLDTSGGILLALEETLDCYGVDYSFLTDKDRETFIGPPMELSLERWFGIRGDKNTEVCSHYRKIYREEKLMVAEPYEGIVKMLTDLKEAGFTLGVASYKKSDYLGRILEGFGLDKYFDVISGSDYSGKLTKSDIIRSSLQTLNIEDKSRVLMVGDTSYDSEGAEGAGIDFCFAEWGFGKRSEVDAVLSAKTPKEIIGFLV